MTTEQAWLAATGALVIGLALVAVLLAVRAQRRAARAEARVAALAERLAVLESPVTHVEGGEGAEVAAPATSAFVITRMDGPEPRQVPVASPIDGRLFADIVARETVVKAASWTHGLRRALSPENRNRIRFAVRQETRRTGRARRAETKQALREYRARERAATADARVEVGEDVA